MTYQDLEGIAEGYYPLEYSDILEAMKETYNIAIEKALNKIVFNVNIHIEDRHIEEVKKEILNLKMS